MRIPSGSFALSKQWAASLVPQVALTTTTTISGSGRGRGSCCQSRPESNSDNECLIRKKHFIPVPTVARTWRTSDGCCRPSAWPSSSQGRAPMKTTSPYSCPRSTRPWWRRTSAPRSAWASTTPITSSGSSPTPPPIRPTTSWSTAARSPVPRRRSTTAERCPSSSQVLCHILLVVNVFAPADCLGTPKFLLTRYDPLLYRYKGYETRVRFWPYR